MLPDLAGSSSSSSVFRIYINSLDLKSSLMLTPSIYEATYRYTCIQPKGKNIHTYSNLATSTSMNIRGTHAFSLVRTIYSAKHIDLAS